MTLGKANINLKKKPGERGGGAFIIIIAALNVKAVVSLKIELNINEK